MKAFKNQPIDRALVNRLLNDVRIDENCGDDHSANADMLPDAISSARPRRPNTSVTPWFFLAHHSDEADKRAAL